MKTTNTLAQSELGLDVPPATAPAKHYRAPVYRVTLVRDGSVTAEATRETADSPAVVAELVRKLIGDSPQEHLVAICVDARSRVIGVSEVSRGTLSASLVHPRETLRTAILLNAAAFIVAHNHPSGDCNPEPGRPGNDPPPGAGLGAHRASRCWTTLSWRAAPSRTGQAKSFFSFREHGLIG